MITAVIWLSLLQASTALISWDTACGVTKGCFPDCTGGCEYLVTWQQSGQTVAFTLQAEEADTNVYLAIGFSEDYRMGDDSVVGCIVPSSQVVSAYNDGLHTETLTPTNLGLASGATSVSQSNGVVTCSFTRDITNSNDKFFDLNDDYIIMLVIGEGDATSLGKHYVIPWNSDKKVDFNSVEIVGLYKLNGPLVKLHGIMMVLAWLLCSVLGIITARYNKDMLLKKTLFGTKVWFQVHRTSMCAVLLFVVLGFIPIFAEIEGYSQIVPSKDIDLSGSHPVIGILVTIFTIANPLAGLFRPDGGHKYRWLFNWGHMLLGVITQVLAVFAIMVGYYMERSMLPESSSYITVAMIIVVFIAVVVLDVLKWKANKKRSTVTVKTEPNTKDGRPATAADMQLEEEPADDQKLSVLPFYILIAVGLVLYGLTVGVIGVIGAS